MSLCHGVKSSSHFSLHCIQSQKGKGYQQRGLKTYGRPWQVFIDFRDKVGGRPYQVSIDFMDKVGLLQSLVPIGHQIFNDNRYIIGFTTEGFLVSG